MVLVREASVKDLESILTIYNQGIEDRIATLETEKKDLPYMKEWYAQHKGHYKALVAEQEERILGWASLSPYNNRCAYAGVAELSVYISREHRGKGIGSLLLTAIEKYALNHHFHKIVLFTFPFNKLGQGLYHKQEFREIGVFKNQGMLDGKHVDVMAMEKLLV